MGRIRELPPHVVNQIAAGEVIERPASVVKELLENALDAGATRIEVSIEAGGRDLIRVVDNGGGIAPDDLPLAVAAHATSKLTSIDDLFHVRTMGFRGEALASIAAVSHLRVCSRQPGVSEGYAIEVQGDRVNPVTACGCPEGTAVDVRNLFFNTPVRRRFLKATQTELGHVVDAFNRVAIAAPHVALVLRHNERIVYELPASAELAERLALFFGAELAKKLIRVDSESNGTRLWGYVADPSETRANPRSQFFFVNGRFIRDRSLQHALTEAYRGLVMVGRYPVAFLFFELPAEAVDVNVHPTKIEVRFRDSSQLYSQLLGTLREKFLRTDLTSRWRLPPAATERAEPGPLGAADEAAALQDRVRQSINDFYQRVDSTHGPPAPNRAAGYPSPESGPRPAPVSTSAPAGVTATTLPARTEPGDGPFHLRSPLAAAPTARLPFPHPPGGAHVERSSPAVLEPTPDRADESPSTLNSQPSTDAQPSTDLNAIQVHNSYLIVETAEGVMVIDQHALHERVLYEELRERVLAGRCEAQRLLVPETIDVTPAELAAIAEHRELLGQLGLDVEPFGGNTAVLHTYPAMLANLPPARLLRDMLDQLTAGTAPPDRRDLLDSLLHMIACKAAIKAGQRLTPDEIRELVALRHLAQDHHHCPHGRPTALVLSKHDLERQFKRV